MIDLGNLGIGKLDDSTGNIPLLLICRNGSTLASATPTGTPTYSIENSAGTEVASGNFPATDHQSRTGHRFVELSFATGTYAAGKSYVVICTYVVAGTTFHAMGAFTVT